MGNSVRVGAERGARVFQDLRGLETEEYKGHEAEAEAGAGAAEDRWGQSREIA